MFCGPVKVDKCVGSFLRRVPVHFKLLWATIRLCSYGTQNSKKSNFLMTCQAQTLVHGSHKSTWVASICMQCHWIKPTRVLLISFLGLAICLKWSTCICVLPQASVLSWVSSKLTVSPSRSCCSSAQTLAIWGAAKGQGRVPFHFFQLYFSLLSFDIYKCLKCNTFLSRYPLHCSAARLLWRAWFSTATPVLLQGKPLKSLQLSRVVSSGLWTCFFVSSACVGLVFVRQIFLPMAMINPQMLF